MEIKIVVNSKVENKKKHLIVYLVMYTKKLASYTYAEWKLGNVVHETTL